MKPLSMLVNCIDEGANYPSNDLPGMPITNATTVEECVEFCRQEPGCFRASFNLVINDCWLKEFDINYTPDNDHTSVVANCCKMLI